jgi:hypothetical protein
MRPPVHIQMYHDLIPKKQEMAGKKLLMELKKIVDMLLLSFGTVVVSVN